MRIRLTNRDPGMSHDFGVPTWKKGTGLLKESGEAVVELTGAAAAGRLRLQLHTTRGNDARYHTR